MTPIAPGERAEISRRRFLGATLSAAGGLVIAFHLPGCRRADEADLFASDLEIPGEVNAWLTIDPDETITIRVARAELGQGVLTALPMIVAEELECEWSDVRFAVADVNRSVRDGGIYRSFNTGGSGAVRFSRKYLQEAGANARERLRHAAAERWQIPVDGCVARDGRIEAPDGKASFSYGELAAAAARVDLGDAPIELKRPGTFRLLGRPTPRLDVPKKVDGSTRYGIDVRRPGLRFAVIRHCPYFGGGLASHDPSAARSMPGVVDVVVVDDAVVVVAETTWQAMKALDAVEIEWRRPTGDPASTPALDARFEAALDEPGQVFLERGATGFEEAGGASVRADYHVPFLAHACLEPLNCTVEIGPERVDVWVGTQNQESVLRLAAEITGRSTDQVFVHGLFVGGAFGRRAYDRHVGEAVRVAMKVGGPVQLLWPREEDMRQGRYRPTASFRFEADLDAAGRPTALRSRSVTQPIFSDEPKHLVDGLDKTSLMGLNDIPYAVPALRFEHAMEPTPVSVGIWRSVGHSQNAFAVESVIDEMALAGGQDPLALRRALLADRSDFLHVLDVLADKASWGRALPEGQGQGLAIHEGMGTIVGQVVEVEVDAAGALRVERVVSAVDCGTAVNPLTIEEQIEGSIIFGLTAALYGEITIADGAAVETNFDRYRLLSLAEAPRMETHLALSGGDKWGGIGEPGLPPIAPALCSAIARATGVRVRKLPIGQQKLRPA